MTKARSKTPASSKTPQKPDLREPTEREADAIRKAREGVAALPARAALSIRSDGDHRTVSNPHKDAAGWGAHLATTLGTASEDSLTQAVHRIGIAVADRGKTSTETQVNAALALMGAVAPRDELEAAIGEQIVAAHTASLDFLHRARSNAGEFVATANIYAGMATKLSRTMGSLVETLAKLRSGGRQRIEVVYVNGPAIIGDHAQAVISTGGPGGGGNTKGDQPHAIDQLASLAYAPGLPMRRQDPDGEPLPSPGGAGSETLSDARRQ